jgi:hypothetical protein
VRRYHPDAGAAPSPASVRPLGGADIVRLNEAWRVLRDPTLRRRYDASLRPPPVAVPVSFYDREGWGQMLDPVFAPVERRPRPPVHRSRRQRIVTRAVVAAVLVLAVGAVVALSGSARGTSAPPALSVPVGSCVTIPVGADARVVPCGRANDGAVVAPVTRTGACPRGAVARSLEAGGRPDVCLAPR